MGPIESEFNVEDYPAEYIAVEVSESMSSVLEKIEDTWTRTPNAVLIIPRGAGAFHNTQDFLALGKLQGARDVRVSVASLDPIIAGLARLLGFYVVDPPLGHPALAGDPTLDNLSMDGDIEQPTVPLPTSGTSANLPNWVLSPTVPNYPPASTTTSTWLNTPGDPALHPWGDPNPKPAQPPGMPPPRTRPRQTTGYLSPNVITDDSLPAGMQVSQPPVSATPTGRFKARRMVPAEQRRGGDRFRYGGRLKPAQWSRLLTVLASILVVALIGGSAYAYVYLPEGTVSVTPLSETRNDIPIEISVMTGSTSGQTARSLNARAISLTLQEDGTHPASGTRQAPRGKAQGLMHFTNRTSSAVSVPAGVQFKAPNGVAVQTTQAGTVPGTNFTAQLFGTLNLPIASTVDGPDGNLSAGQMVGIYGGSLTYSNLTMQGGAMETVKVATQADVDALAADLRSQAEGKAASALLDMTPAGYQLITQTIALTDAQFLPDHQANQDGDNLSMKFTASAQANVYKESDLHDSVAQAVLDSVQSSIPQAVGPNLDLGSVQYTPPVVKSVEPGRVVYSTSASGRITFALTPELARQIRDLVKGQNINQARNLLFQKFGTYINPDSIEARVLWFTLDTLPSNPSRINVQPSAGQGSYTPSAPPAQTTPDPRSQP